MSGLVIQKKNSRGRFSGNILFFWPNIMNMYIFQIKQILDQKLGKLSNKYWQLPQTTQQHSHHLLGKMLAKTLGEMLANMFIYGI